MNVTAEATAATTSCWPVYVLVSLGSFYFFLGPLVMVIGILLASMYLCLYKWFNRSSYHENDELANRQFWKRPLNLISRCWYYQARMWHGYEIVGIDHIPENESALLIFYHAQLPLDIYYFVAAMNVLKQRRVRAVIDKDAHRFLGMQTFFEACEVNPGTQETCIRDLCSTEDSLLAISPGGTHEGFLGDNLYRILWKNRKGFAKVAQGAKVTRVSLETLIDCYQTIPGSITKALLSRCVCHSNKSSSSGDRTTKATTNDPNDEQREHLQPPQRQSPSSPV